MALHESGENYLESIYVLHRERGHVRSVDVANYFGFSKPSVSRAVSILKNDGYLEVADDGRLILTETGLKTAKNIYDRHRILKAVLMNFGIDEAVAADDACRIEHVISEESFIKIRQYAAAIGITLPD